MRRRLTRTGLRALWVAVACLAALAAAGPASAATIAYWRFEPGNLLADSSGNGNTLTLASGAAVADVGDVGLSAGSRASAYFNGSSILKTLASLNLSPYQQIRISWWMKNQVDTTYTPGNAELVFEHSSTFNSYPGGFLVSVNEALPGHQGAVGLKTSGSYNLDAFPHNVPDAGHPNGDWEQMAVVYNRASPNAANVIRVYRNGVLLSDQPYNPGYQATDVAPFRNDTFFVGGRGSSSLLSFKGNIDDLKIESISASSGPIAYWRFEPGAETVDSSGNGNTLTNSGAVSSSDVAAGSGSGGSISFNGTSASMRTTNTLDLSPYRHLGFTFWMKVEGTSPGIVFEQNTNFLNRPGAVVFDVNDGIPSTTTGKAGVSTSSPHFNLDDYSHAPSPGQWQKVDVRFNRDAVAPDITKVYIDGKLASKANQLYADTVSFINDTLYLGARAGASSRFKGKLDEMKIEELPPQPLKVFILAGQSNAMGQYASKSSLPTALQGAQEDVILRADGTWTTLQPGRNTATTNDFGPEITFGRAMADAWKGENIAIIKVGYGATTLAGDWNPDNPGPRYTDLLNAVNTAMAELSVGYDAEIAGMLWMQGESDAFTLANAQAYEANLRNFIQSVRDDLGTENLPFVIGQISDAAAWTYGDTVQLAQWNVGQTMPFTTTILTNDLSLISNHYDAAGQMELGYRFAAGMLTLIPEPSTACLFGLGGLVLACRARRGRRRAGRIAGSCPGTR
jgi:hypothetical protein